MRELKALGVEDGSFDPRDLKRRGKTILCCTLMENLRFEDVRLRLIEVDGLDATEKLIDMAKTLETADVIMLGGITFAGFNLVDPVEVYGQFKVPIIVVTRDKPDNQSVLEALKKHFADWSIRYEVFRRLADISPVYELKPSPKENPVYVEVVGMAVEEAFEVLKKTTIRGRMPEPIRLANSIAKAASRLTCS
ncbi:MAG: DUF99 family protein [Candidatus Nezhaarchaeota archaeon]|nr:DUF99 family protein [Candidatus Nezhaarchaeota archaeon]